jgi:hypothetical protein
MKAWSMKAWLKMRPFLNHEGAGVHEGCEDG